MRRAGAAYSIKSLEPSPSGRGQGEGARGISDGAGKALAEYPHPDPLPEGEGEGVRGGGPTLRTAGDLLAAGLIDESRRAEIDAVAREFALAVTPDMAALIDPGDPADPIAAQFVPRDAELTVAPEERADPIGDAAHSPVKGIVHRYPDRVLLKPIHVCSVYCRFCFRRETVGRRPALSRAELDAALDYIRAHSEIWEVILTGGDPLVLSPRRLRDIVQRLASIEHVKIIR